MVKDILQIGEKILNKKTTPVKEINSEDTKQILTDLFDTCKKNADISAGLAAPQIGYNSRICVCRRVDLEALYQDQEVADDKLWEILINPHLIKKSKSLSTEWEACLSIGEGEDNLWGPVERNKKITVEFITPNGKTKTLTAEGYFAHIIQHEIDHLNGILFVSHISNPQNLWKLRDLNKYIDSNQTYPEIL